MSVLGSVRVFCWIMESLIVMIVLVTYIAQNVLCERDAISEQRVVIHHAKPESSSLSEIGVKKQEYHEEYPTAYPSYEFSYKVNDPETQDIKGQHEKRHGDEVKGLYWLVEPNGHKRTVNYQANDFNGFNAQVNYSDQENNKETSKKIESEAQEENVDMEENNKNNNENNDDEDGTKNQETENVNTEMSEQGKQENNEQVDSEDNGETENDESENKNEDEKGADSEIVIKTNEPYKSNVNNYTVKSSKILQNNDQQDHGTQDKTVNEVNSQVINDQRNKKSRNHSNTKHNKNKSRNVSNNANVSHSEIKRDDRRRRGENNQVKMLKKQNNNKNKLNDVQDLYINNVNNQREPAEHNNNIRIINLDAFESSISNDEIKNAKSEHRIYIRHPKFPTTNSKNKKH